MFRGCVAMLSTAPKCHRTSHVKPLFSKKNTSKTKEMSNDLGSHTQLWSFCQCALVILAQEFMVKAPGTLVLETANTHALAESKSTPILAMLLYEPRTALESVALDVFCCSNLKTYILLLF